MWFLEVFLLGIALAMDACAVAMICGMTEKGIRVKRALLIGGFFGIFQFLHGGAGGSFGCEVY